jgi:hypothetical protein
MVEEFEEASATVDVEQSQFIGNVADAICSLGIRPQILTGYLVDHMRRHFAQTSHIEEVDLRRLLWRPGQDPDILIESIFKWDPTTTERRPAILVKRNSYQNVRQGIDDRQQGIIADAQGNPCFETFWVGSHTVFAIGKIGAQVEILAAEVQRELTQMGPVVHKCLDLYKFRVQQLGAVAELEEATENFVVPINVAIAYNEKWKIRAVAPPLSGVTISTLLDC